MLSPEAAATLGTMARYRNRLVHFYDEIGEGELYDILTTNLGDFGTIIAAVTAWMTAHPDRIAADD